VAPGKSLSEAFPASREALAESFAGGLERMLAQHDDLGVYILVLANAVQDTSLWSHLRARLLDRHQRHAATLVAALRAGRRLAAPPDDLLVFLKLLAIGFDHLQVSEHRRTGPWEVQFNPLRALRPARMSHALASGLMRPFDPQGFHFDRPFLRREVMWAGELAGRPARLLYNKFPFAPLHGLLVPAPAEGWPQMLTQAWHGWACEATRQVAIGVPGFGLAYNSYGAYASVNHLHFQSHVRDAPLPVECLEPARYPLPVSRFERAPQAWDCLEELHRNQTPYNLLYTAEAIFVIPRRRQGEVDPEAWHAGHAWSEVAGAFTVSSRDDFERLNADALFASLARLRC